MTPILPNTVDEMMMPQNLYHMNLCPKPQPQDEDLYVQSSSDEFNCKKKCLQLSINECTFSLKEKEHDVIRSHVLEKMIQGQIGFPSHPLPHHLRSNCRPKPGQSSFKRSKDQSLYVRFIDEVEEQVGSGKGAYKIRWSSIVTETRTRPRTKKTEKAELFYSKDELSRFRQEYWELMFKHAHDMHDGIDRPTKVDVLGWASNVLLSLFKGFAKVVGDAARSHMMPDNTSINLHDIEDTLYML